MRLFIAINFPQNIKAKILKQVIILKKQFPRISWVKETNLHLTLKFLGYTKEEKVLQVKKGIEVAVKDLKTFKLSISGLDYFPREPLIILVNIEHSKTLDDLVRSLEYEMAKIWFRHEKRPYSPHITIGRGRRLKKEEVEDIKQVIKEKASFSPIKFSVKEIILMQSQLTRAGSIYTVLDTYKLAV